MRLAGKVALISGAASGMGAAQARLFVREGAAVLLADLLIDQGRALAAEIGQEEHRAAFVSLDVTNDSGWAHAVAAAERTFGRLDILVNNAGISTSGADQPMTEAEWDRLMAVNAKGAFLGLRHAVPAIERAGGGAVVNIGSIAAFNGQAGLHPGYGASKAAVVGLTRSAALRYARAGVRVNAVHPGFMPPMRTARSVDPRWRPEMVSRVPIGRERRVASTARSTPRRIVPRLRRCVLRHRRSAGGRGRSRHRAPKRSQPRRGREPLHWTSGTRRHGARWSRPRSNAFRLCTSW